MVRRVVAHQRLGVLGLHLPIHGVHHNSVEGLDVCERIQKAGKFGVEMQLQAWSGFDGRHGAQVARGGADGFGEEGPQKQLSLIHI